MILRRLVSPRGIVPEVNHTNRGVSLTTENEDRLSRAEARIAQTESALRVIDNLLIALEAKKAGHRVRRTLEVVGLLVLAGSAIAVPLLKLSRDSIDGTSTSAEAGGGRSSGLAA